MAKQKQARQADRTPALPHEPHGALAVVTYLVATLALAYPAFAGKFLVSARSDQYIGGFALRDFATMWERAGHGVPLWNPYIFGGMPYVASMNGDMFYPTALLRLAFGTDVGMTLGFIVHVFLAGCFTYLFLRRAMRMGFYGSLVGGLAYMIGGNVAGLVSPGHDGKLFVATLLPLALFFVHRGVRDGRRWAWGALALTVTLAFLSPHPQLFQYLLLALGAYALFIAFSPADDGSVLARRDALVRLGLALASVVVGTLGGAIQYLPLMEYTPWSPRAGGTGWEHAVSYSMPPEELLNTYLPQFSGILDNYSGRNGIHFHSEYIGAAVLVLASLALGARVVPRRVVWFWTIALVVAVLWALGGYTPFYHLVYAIVPGTKFFRAPSTMLFFVSFCTAVLAAIGTERLLREEFRISRVVGWLVFAAVMALLAVTGALSTLASGFADPRVIERVDGNRSALMIGSVRALLAVAATAYVAIAVRKQAMAPWIAAWLLVAVVGLDLWSIVRRYWVFSPPAAQLYASDPLIQYLQKLPEPGRVLPLAMGQMTSRRRDPYFGGGDGRGDGLMVHHVRSVFGYHGNELGRYDDLTGWDSREFPRTLLSTPNLWRLLNIQYVMTNAPVAPIPGSSPVLPGTKNAAGNTVFLFKLPIESPMAWVTPLAVTAPDSAVLPGLLNPRFDVRRVALFAPGTRVKTQSAPPSLPEPTTVRAHVTTMEPGHIVVALDAPAPASSALMVSENYYPGWRATVDGATAAVDRADYVLMGVGLPAGARKVELTFHSDAYERGRLITIVALLIALLALGAGIATSPRREPLAA